MPEPQLERKMTLKFRTPPAEMAVIADADHKKTRGGNHLIADIRAANRIDDRGGTRTCTLGRVSDNRQAAPALSFRDQAAFRSKLH